MALAAKIPFRHPYAAGFPGLGSQPMPTDADALDYLDRMAAADGTSVEVGVATAVSAFFRDTKAAGVFSSLKACCILAGARTLAGALVPVVGDAPTNVANGFVNGDFSRTSGLTGDGTSYLDSGRSSDDDPAADCHLAVYATSPPSGTLAMYVGGQVSNPYDIYRSNTDMQFRNGGAQVASGLGLSTGLIASTRNAANSFSIRVSGTTTTAASVARTPNDVNMFVFARNAPGGTDFISDATIAFYSIGTSLSLEDLDIAVTNLITAIGEAL